MAELNPIIKEVARVYGLFSDYDQEIDRWTIRDIPKDNPNGADFFWSDNYSYEDFFDDLKRYFAEQSEGRYGW